MVMLSTMLGAVFSGWLGWLESGEPFDERKMLATMLRGVLMALVEFVSIAALLPDMVLSVAVLVSGFLIGAGFDVLLKRGQSAIEAQTKTYEDTPTGQNV